MKFVLTTTCSDYFIAKYFESGARAYDSSLSITVDLRWLWWRDDSEQVQRWQREDARRDCVSHVLATKFIVVVSCVWWFSNIDLKLYSFRGEFGLGARLSAEFDLPTSDGSDQHFAADESQRSGYIHDGAARDDSHARL